MAKIAMTTTKYTIQVKLNADGVVEKSDVVGAIFGQTEGLLGDDLELRELQRTGRIGRIEVKIQTKSGKSSGTIEVPTSLSKEETALIAASVETINRVGPCEAEMKVEKVIDVRESKRKQVMDKAKLILKDMIDSGLPDSMEISESVKTGVREKTIKKYGPDKLAAGPDIDKSDEVIIVEGRADVVNLLRAGIKNAIAIGGTGVPKTIKDLSKKKTCVAFLDGDRGGDLILKELEQTSKIKSVARAPEGKEVEELTQKEILQALRGTISLADATASKTTRPRSVSTTPTRARGSTSSRSTAPRSRSSADSRTRSSSRGPSRSSDRSGRSDRRGSFRSGPRTGGRSGGRSFDRGRGRSYDRPSPVNIDAKSKAKYKTTLDKLAGSDDAELMNKLSSVGRIPSRDLPSVLKNMGSAKVDAIVIDGEISQSAVDAASDKGVTLVIGTHRAFKKRPSGVDIITQRDL